MSDTHTVRWPDLIAELINEPAIDGKRGRLDKILASLRGAGKLATERGDQNTTMLTEEGAQMIRDAVTAKNEEMKRSSTSANEGGDPGNGEGVKDAQEDTGEGSAGGGKQTHESVEPSIEDLAERPGPTVEKAEPDKPEKPKGGESDEEDDEPKRKRFRIPSWAPWALLAAGLGVIGFSWFRRRSAGQPGTQTTTGNESIGIEQIDPRTMTPEQYQKAMAAEFGDSP